jgi:hypothetical protein
LQITVEFCEKVVQVTTVVDVSVIVAVLGGNVAVSVCVLTIVVFCPCKVVVIVVGCVMVVNCV